MKYTIYCRTKSQNTGSVTVKPVARTRDVEKDLELILRLASLHPENEYYVVPQSTENDWGDIVLSVIASGPVSMFDCMNIVRV